MSRPKRPFIAPFLAGLGTVAVIAAGVGIFNWATTDDKNDPAPTTTSSTTVQATSTTNTSPSTSTSVVATSNVVILESDGLGVARLGDNADSTVEKLTAALGPITSDTGWKPVGPESIFQACPGIEARYVEWNGLSVFLNSEDDTTTQGAGRQFAAWQLVQTDTVTEAKLRTAEDIGIGSSVDELRTAYGSRVSVTTDDDVFGPSYSVVRSDASVDDYSYPSFFGSLDDFGTTITSISAGQGCGE